MRTFDENVYPLAVKRLLRRQDSREYFKDGAWTRDPDQANCFSDVVEAAETCARYGLDNVELALRIEPAKHDIFSTPIR
jgi:hypothetical protein